MFGQSNNKTGQIQGQQITRGYVYWQAITQTSLYDLNIFIRIPNRGKQIFAQLLAIYLLRRLT